MATSGRQTEIALSQVFSELQSTPSGYLRAARLIEAADFPGLKPMTVAVLATFTSEPLRPYLIVEGARRGLAIRPYFAPFNQLEQQAFDANSEVYGLDPQVVIIAARLEELSPALTTRFVKMSAVEIGEELSQIAARFRALIKALRVRTAATMLIFNFGASQFLAAGIADQSLPVSQAAAWQRANDALAAVCREFADVHVFDCARASTEFGLRKWFDPKLWWMGRIPFSAEAQLEIGRRLGRALRAAALPACKCLVLDLDNTLWGGVLGEDGLGGIALSEDYPGSVYKDWQRRLLALRDRGVLLAVASKNNEADALEVFEKHSDCLLKADDFAARQINWLDKASSLAAIAEELNIGTEALAFFDDNPIEREWVRSRLPEVNVIEVPNDPMRFAEALDRSGAFDHLSISREDRSRAELYQKEGERRRLLEKTGALEDFLHDLDMIVTIGSASGDTLPRVSQLIAKTNQFNLTTRRHTAAEIESMIDNGAIALWLRVADRFGDNGLVGVALALNTKGKDWTVDTFLLSCRVIGRGVETALLRALADKVRMRGGVALVGEYIQTGKNLPAVGFYLNHGFVSIDDSGRFFRMDLIKQEIDMPDYLQVNVDGD